MSRRSNRVTTTADPADDVKLLSSINHFKKVWRNNLRRLFPKLQVKRVVSPLPKTQTSSSSATGLPNNSNSYIPGVILVEEFLNLDEVKALRAIFDAHRSWLSYSYGTSQSNRNLNSSLLRLDFGPEDMRPEGVVGENDTKTWRVGKLRQYILDLVVERFKLAYEIQRSYGCSNCERDQNGCESCRKAAQAKFQNKVELPITARGAIPFWEDGRETPNMLQLTQIQPW